MGTLGFSISDFRSSMNSAGVLRSHSYMIMINPPPSLSEYDTAQLTLRCDSVNMPGINFMTQDGIYRYGYGPAEVMPYNVMFTPVTMSLMVDRAASQYTFFNLWMNSIFDMNMQGGILGRSADSSPYEVAYKEDYAVTMNMFVFNETADKVIELTFQEAYPLLMQDTPLAWGEQQNIIRLQISMAYKTFYMKTIEGFSTASEGANVPPVVREAFNQQRQQQTPQSQPAIYRKPATTINTTPLNVA
jgi:hypothetical protein